jgi:hypothetical protein
MRCPRVMLKCALPAWPGALARCIPLAAHGAVLMCRGSQGQVVALGARSGAYCREGGGVGVCVCVCVCVLLLLFAWVLGNNCVIRMASSAALLLLTVSNNTKSWCCSCMLLCSHCWNHLHVGERACGPLHVPLIIFILLPEVPAAGVGTLLGLSFTCVARCCLPCVAGCRWALLLVCSRLLMHLWRPIVHGPPFCCNSASGCRLIATLP